MQLPRHLVLLEHGRRALADGLRRVGAAHRAEPDVVSVGHTLAALLDSHRETLVRMLARYPLREDPPGPDAVPPVPASGTLVADLHDLHTLGAWLEVAWAIAGQSARALRDDDLRELADRGVEDAERCRRWLRGRIDQAAPQTMLLE